MERAENRIDVDVIRRMQREIERAEGREILFVGTTDAEMRVTSVDVYARGSFGAVAAPAEYCQRGDVVIHNHPGGRLDPSEADVAVAAQLAELGIGSAIVDNDVEEIYVLVEAVPPDEITPIDEETLAAYLEADGAVAALLPGYRLRPSQVEMLRAVTRGFNDEGIVVAEAGTGVGKSFAYLIPAIAWAAANRRRIVIATATINLQQQLIDKDLTFVQRALGTDVPTALVKGRGNYLCHRRFREYQEEATLFDDPDEMVLLREWAETTETGSRSDLPSFVSDETWSAVNSEPDTCSAARCPNRERCFILKARRRAAAAQVLVANHHLVFSDLSIRRAGAGWENTAVLPPFQTLIFDEAHNLERAATSFFSESVSYRGITRQLARVLRRRGARRFGLLDRLPGVDAATEPCVAVEKELDHVREQAGRFNDRLVLFLGDESSWRLTADTVTAFRTHLAPEFVEMHRSLTTLIARMNALARGVDDRHREDPAFLEFVAIQRRFDAIASVLNRFADGFEDETSVFWLERRRGATRRSNDSGTERRRDWVRVVITPLDLRPLMEEAVYQPYATVVMTSATLAVNGSFAFWGGRLGLPLEDERVEVGQFPSPFDYHNRVTLAVPADAPFPDNERYETYLIQLIQRLVNASNGGALILFTSYRQLSSVFEAVAPALEQRGFPCYRQGSEDRAHLMATFVDDHAGVLFATDSFWEGIDAPGETLRLVVVCRLPFRVPTDPVQRARAEAIEATGGNSFYDFSLPQAVMRLKQGFGRLMRRNDDYGVVVVTDPRMIKKSYGRVFWNSLPPADPLITHGEALVEEVSARLGRYSSSS